MLAGDVVISLAGVDLVQVRLHALITHGARRHDDGARVSERPVARFRGLPQRLETDAESVERDLFKLVLTIIELVRQLMEKQALRRVDEGDLTDEQIEGARHRPDAPATPWRSSRSGTASPRGPQHRPRPAGNPAG